MLLLVLVIILLQNCWFSSLEKHNLMLQIQIPKYILGQSLHLCSHLESVLFTPEEKLFL